MLCSIILIINKKFPFFFCPVFLLLAVPDIITRNFLSIQVWNYPDRFISSEKKKNRKNKTKRKATPDLLLFFFFFFFAKIFSRFTHPKKN